MLRKRSMDEIDQEFYRSAFNFPVIDYYKKIGFDLEKESFEELSVEFISEYNSRVDTTSLQKSALEVLSLLHQQGRKQVIISAMEQNMLIRLLHKFNIYHFFDEVVGLTDIYARGKVKLAKDFIRQNNIDTSQSTFIGDTLHDAEVAEEIGSEILLVSNGHHNKERLSINGYKIVPSLSTVLSGLN
jgi:phosphoglycolate phosphatase